MRLPSFSTRDGHWRAQPSRRHANVIRMLQAIRSHGPTSKAELARVTRLSQPTVVGIVDRFIEQELVRVVGQGQTSRGRKPTLLELNPARGFVVAANFDDDYRLETVVVDLLGRWVARDMRQVPGGDPVAMAQVLSQTSRALCQQAGIEPEAIIGVSVIAPGVVDPQSGVIHYSVHLNLRDVPFKAILERHFPDKPIFLDNHPNAAAYKELIDGVGQQFPNFAFVWLGTTLSAGIVFHRELYRGLNGCAGQFGHTVLDPRGPVCRCGNRGCLEAVYRATLQDVVRETELWEHDRWAHSVDLSPELLREMVENAPQHLGPTYDVLQMGIASFLNVYNPDAVVLGGELVPVSDEEFEAFARAILDRTLLVIRDNTVIMRSRFGKSVILEGAALMAQQKFLMEQALQL